MDRKQYIVLATSTPGEKKRGGLEPSSCHADKLASMLGKAFPEGATVPVTRSLVDESAMLELSEEQAASFERANPNVNLYPARTYRLAAVDVDTVMMASKTIWKAKLHRVATSAYIYLIVFLFEYFDRHAFHQQTCVLTP